MFALILFVVIANAQPFMNMYGQQFPFAHEQDSFRAEQVLHGLNMKYMQMKQQLYNTAIALRGTERRRYFAASAIELYGSEHTVQFLKLKQFRLRRTIAIVLKQMGKILTSLPLKDRNMVVVHLGIPASTITAMKKAVNAKVPEVPANIPLVGHPFGFMPQNF